MGAKSLGAKSMGANTTLADLLPPLLVANPFSAMAGIAAAGGRAMSSRMAWRTAGKVGWGRWPVDSFFSPPCSCQGGDGWRKAYAIIVMRRMAVKALPGSSLEVIETEFFLQLLVSLFANPSRLDGSRQGAQVGPLPAGWRDSISSLPTPCVRR